VILDEAQALPRHLLRPSLASLKELARGYKSSVVFCTATQPAICREDGFPHAEGLDRVGPMPVRELAPDPIGLYQKLRRVQVTFDGKLSDKKIVRILARDEGGLCIVNNRKHAKAIFKACRHLENVYHLSTNMTAAHRRSVLLKIREALKNGPVRLISTSLIEAGVDISFPVVLRENAGMDSIAQAAGRCNREGECEGLGRVIVFETDEADYRAPRDLQLLAAISRRIMTRYSDDPLSSGAIKAYFEEAFWRASHAMDCGTVAGQPFSIMDAIRGAGRRDVQIPYRSIAEAYRLIEDGGVPIIITGGEWGIDENLLELAAERGDARALARMVQSYQVQVPSKVFAKMLEDGAISAFHKEKYEHQFHINKGFDGYCEKVGLQWG
jgi:CRISPR-associated endonuclease/helicase Cas3